MLCSSINSALTFFNPLPHGDQKKEPEIKAYGVNSWDKYTVKSALNGEDDTFDESNYRQFNFYKTFQEAKNNAYLLQGKGMKKRHGYVFEFACTEPQVQELAKKSHFSATIIAAYNSYELSFDPIKKATRIPNQNFNANSLAKLLANLKEEAASPSNCKMP